VSLFTIASFNASIVRSADRVLPKLYPTTFLEYASIIAARYTNDVNILIYVISACHTWLMHCGIIFFVAMS
jgi:hypothetical protein